MVRHLVFAALLLLALPCGSLAAGKRRRASPAAGVAEDNETFADPSGLDFDAPGPTGPPETALERFSNLFGYTPARFVSAAGTGGQLDGYKHLTGVPTGEELQTLLIESVQLDLTRQAEIQASGTCGFPLPGPHENQPQQQPLYKAFFQDPQLHGYIVSLLDGSKSEVTSRAGVLCRNWARNGYAVPTWTGAAGSELTLPSDLATITPGGVLARRFAGGGTGAAGGSAFADILSPQGAPAPAPAAGAGATPVPAGQRAPPRQRSPPPPPWPPLQWVQMDTPSNTKFAPPYKPAKAWGYDPAIFEVFFAEPGTKDKGRRAWVASPWA